jgi:hypothetical protein
LIGSAEPEFDSEVDGVVTDMGDLLDFTGTLGDIPLGVVAERIVVSNFGVCCVFPTRFRGVARGRAGFLDAVPVT